MESPSQDLQHDETVVIPHNRRQRAHPHEAAVRGHQGVGQEQTFDDLRLSGSVTCSGSETSVAALARIAGSAVATDRGEGVTESIANPILNAPYEQPDRYFEVGAQGPTGEIRLGRRPSESFIPIAVARKGRKSAGDDQTEIDFDITGERREKNSLINDLRREVRVAPGRLRQSHTHHPQAPPALGGRHPREQGPVLSA